MITGFLTFLFFFAIVGSILYGRRFIKTEKVDAVFGSRFIKGSKIIDYPKKKLILNRIFNFITKILFLSNLILYNNKELIAVQMYEKNNKLSNKKNIG